MLLDQARNVIRWCRVLAEYTEEPGHTTRTFLSDPMRDVHTQLSEWMGRLGMRVQIDAAGNLRGVYASADSRRGTGAEASPAESSPAPRLFIGSHLDTVRRAGAFDGVLGVVMAVALVELLDGRRFPFSIEIVGFSDEEGVRFGIPFIGSRALAGALDAELLERTDANGRRLHDVIREYGLDPARIEEAHAGPEALGFLECHIEQGPVLDDLGIPLASVDAIVGQSRGDLIFTGTAGHAGTTPMLARKDALACAAEWVGIVEHEARSTPGLVATVGRLDALPGSVNVIAGSCWATLDVRHSEDEVRQSAVDRLTDAAHAIAARRGLEARWESHLDVGSVATDRSLTAMLDRAIERCGFPASTMSSGAGHDAMIVARRMPVAMLFLRTPGGISHHPDESVAEEDVAAALAVGRQFLDELEESQSRL